MNETLKAVLYWAVGVVLAFVLTALPIMLSLVARLYGISPSQLSSLINAWCFGSIILASIPALMVALDVATDEQLQEFGNIGQRMILHYNVVAWTVWPFAVLYLLHRRMFPSDEKEA